MEGLKKPLSRALSLALMMAMAFFGMLAITQAVYATPGEGSAYSVEVEDSNGNCPEDIPLFTDSNKVYNLSMSTPEDGSYRFHIMLEGDNATKAQAINPEAEDSWYELKNSGEVTFWSLDDEKDTLTLYSKAIWNEVKDNQGDDDEPHVLLTASLEKKIADNTW